jgi:hypothetical protein
MDPPRVSKVLSGDVRSLPFWFIRISFTLPLFHSYTLTTSYEFKFYYNPQNNQWNQIFSVFCSMGGPWSLPFSFQRQYSSECTNISGVLTRSTPLCNRNTKEMLDENEDLDSWWARRQSVDRHENNASWECSNFITLTEGDWPNLCNGFI